MQSWFNCLYTNYSVSPLINNKDELECPRSNHPDKCEKKLYLCREVAGMIWPSTHKEYICSMCIQYLTDLRNFWFCPYCENEHRYYICSSCEKLFRKANKMDKMKAHEEDKSFD